MQADFSIELGRDDHALEVPWASPDGTQRYLNLKRQPELLLHVLEATDNRELAEFLVALNAPQSSLETAKCDTWLSNEIHPEEEIFGAPWKFGSYVDVLFTDLTHRAVLKLHEELVRGITALLKRAPDFAASADFVVRRCYTHLHVNPDNSADPDTSEDGYCITLYVSGFGDDEADARKNWVIGLKVVQNALMQAVAQQQRRATGPA
ncbi:MAG TPA: hypothetical protein VM009_00120 [Terriglobales bacterium]|nr:hypothetical protein [Terriglobales bacterium]